MNTYRITWYEIVNEVEDEHYEDIEAENVKDAILIWAINNMKVEVEKMLPIKPDIKRMHKIDIQAFYSKSDGKFQFTSLNIAKERYSK